MGADRRGPLAAFIIIAIIAAILLVTSVRSQAAPGWLDPEDVSATVALASTSALAEPSGSSDVGRTRSGPGTQHEPAPRTDRPRAPEQRSERHGHARHLGTHHRHGPREQGHHTQAQDVRGCHSGR